MNQKGITAVIVLSIVAVIVVLGVLGIYFFVKPEKNANKNTNAVLINTNVNKNKNANTNLNVNATVNTNTTINTNTAVNTNTTVNTNTATDETTGWNTYSNDNWGFSFKYPKEWSVINDTVQSEGESSLDEYLLIGEPDVSEKLEPTSMSFHINPAGWGTSPVDLRYSCSYQAGSGFVVVDEYVPTNTMFDDDPNKHEIWVKNARYNDIGFSMMFIDKMENTEGWENKVKNILSTFQFTD